MAPEGCPGVAGQSGGLFWTVSFQSIHSATPSPADPRDQTTARQANKSGTDRKCQKRRKSMSMFESLKNWMKEKKFSRKKEHEHSLVWGSTRTGMTDSKLQQVINPQHGDFLEFLNERTHYDKNRQKMGRHE